MRFGRHRARVAAFLLVLIATLTLSAPVVATPTATVTAEFVDSCRDFDAHSTKDISHVVIDYADGRVVKDESITTPDHSIDGGPGDEIDSVEVKSGRSRENFTCTRTNSPPTAVLERRAGSFGPDPSGTWTSDDCTWRDCFYSVPTAPGSTVPDERAVSFRGICSADPDDDIVSWSLDFGDGTTRAGGSWAIGPPVEVVHDYAATTSRTYTVTLTVTDSGGQSNSDAMAVSVILFDTND